MNPKFQELIEKAARQINAEPRVQDQVLLEKLCEAIVTKCAVIASRCETNGTEHIGAEILDHFGL